MYCDNTFSYGETLLGLLYTNEDTELSSEPYFLPKTFTVTEK